MPKPTKADLICGLLSYWDPLAFEGKAGPMFYNYKDDRNLIKLHRYADNLGCKKILATYMEVLL